MSQEKWVLSITILPYVKNPAFSEIYMSLFYIWEFCPICQYWDRYRYCLVIPDRIKSFFYFSAQYLLKVSVYLQRFTRYNNIYLVFTMCVTAGAFRVSFFLQFYLHLIAPVWSLFLWKWEVRSVRMDLSPAGMFVLVDLLSGGNFFQQPVF